MNYDNNYLTVHHSKDPQAMKGIGSPIFTSYYWDGCGTDLKQS